MPKEIKITEDESGDVNFTTIGFSQFEVLGLLRLYEQQWILRILEQTKHKPKKKAIKK